MRYSNGLLALASSDYQTFLWGVTPKIDAQGRGNGDIDFDRKTARGIITRYIQIQLTIHANESFLVQENMDCLFQENGDKILWKIN